MLRLRAPNHERLLQSALLEATFGGGEANVAVSLANYGMDAEYFTVLPDNPIGKSCISELRRFGVNTNKIMFASGRMGTYYVENGANQRPSMVVYDRENSAIALSKPGDVDWDKVFDGVEWFHITGITPAISESAMELSLESVKVAKEKGITVFVDDDAMNKKAEEILHSLGFNVNVRKQALLLSEAQKQLVEIGRALVRNLKVIILDEPTSALMNAEVDMLFDVIQKLKERGITVIYITHRIEELFRIADSR